MTGCSSFGGGSLVYMMGCSLFEGVFVPLIWPPYTPVPFLCLSVGIGTLGGRVFLCPAKVVSQVPNCMAGDDSQSKEQLAEDSKNRHTSFLKRPLGDNTSFRPKKRHRKSVEGVLKMLDNQVQPT